MNLVWPRFFRAIYRKEPISSFIFTAGAMNVAIGGINTSWPLLAFGLGAVGLAVALRWWYLIHQAPEVSLEERPVRALPPQASRTQLPTLRQKRRP